MRARAFLLAVAVPFLFSGCGGGGPNTPPPSQYTISGSVSGLEGAGLVLQDNGGDNLSVSANGSFTFKTPVTSGGAYSVTVLTQPSSPAQTCAVTNGAGTATANVSNVQVACAAATYTIGGSVSGLQGTGLVLQDDGGDNLSVSANGSFTFKTPVTSGGAYSVTILIQPSSPAQSCAVTNGAGTATANVTSVQVACTTVTHTIGGTVSNLAGTNGGLQLSDNGNDLLSVSGNGSFTFAEPVADDSAYAVTISIQPSNPAQNCEVTNGAGTATADVTNVLVDCGHGEWSWMGGSKAANQAGTYGTLGTPAAANIPGGRTGPAAWVDKLGTFWLFGGIGYDSAGTRDNLNDLWKYSNGEWTWVGGSDLVDQAGIYGTMGTPSPSNIPGARCCDAAWTGASGNVWLFGGGSAGGTGEFNDLWTYSASEWTWIAGPNTLDAKGIYGTLGTPSAGNTPGARDSETYSTDPSGNLWLFGGYGYDSAGTYGTLNDLWEYSNGQWTWMAGSNVTDQKGTYGTLGTPSPTNTPGARCCAKVWTDASGNVWLFGGGGYDSAGTSGQLNDLWKFSNGEWTWMGGSDVANGPGVYGTEGVPAASNTPGARASSLAWTDASGNVWLFGGFGYDSAGRYGFLNDLWKYDGSEWTWVGGPKVANQQGVYGSEGTPFPGNIPGARGAAAIWVDASGNVWLFGGLGEDSVGTAGQLSDLWKYEP